MSNSFSVWCDGALNKERNLGGTGWVVVNNGKLKEGKEPVSDIHSSMRPFAPAFIEIRAFERSLATLPDGAAAHVRMDNAKVIRWLEKGAITGNDDAANTLALFFTMASAQKARMASVTFTRVASAANENFIRATELSREARTTAYHLR